MKNAKTQLLGKLTVFFPSWLMEIRAVKKKTKRKKTSSFLKGLSNYMRQEDSSSAGNTVTLMILETL